MQVAVALALLLGSCFGVPCPDSAPLYCPTADKCCQSGLPYHCGDSCYRTSTSASSSCAGAVEQCAGNGGNAASGPQQCANLGSGQLYCMASTIPQTLSGGVMGACCAVVSHVTGAVISASEGYLCAFGSDKIPQGCYDTLEFARQQCPNAPSIVHCTNLVP